MSQFPFQVIGAVIILTGVLSKAFPNIIAGYNTMTAEEKKNVDIKKLSSFLRNNLVAMGLVLIALGYGLKWAGRDASAYIWVMVIMVVVWTIPMVAIAQKYDHNNKK